jgi:hypothetical protein
MSQIQLQLEAYETVNLFLKILTNIRRRKIKRKKRREESEDEETGIVY